MTSYDIDAAGYILDTYNRNALSKMDEDTLKILVYSECDKLSLANEECDFGTFGENFSHDVNYSTVYEYIKKIVKEI